MLNVTFLPVNKVPPAQVLTKFQTWSWSIFGLLVQPWSEIRLNRPAFLLNSRLNLNLVDQKTKKRCEQPELVESSSYRSSRARSVEVRMEGKENLNARYSKSLSVTQMINLGKVVRQKTTIADVYKFNLENMAWSSVPKELSWLLKRSHLQDGEYVTIEEFIDGDFTKYLNNTGLVCGNRSTDECKKAECLTHYSYEKSSEKLMLLDIQGSMYTLFDPEIASATLLIRFGIFVWCWKSNIWSHYCIYWEPCLQ